MFRSLEQLDALTKHALPVVSMRILELGVLVGSPFLEQHRRAVLAQEEGGEGFLERTAKEQRRSGLFFSPAIEIPEAIASGTGQVLSDLGVAVSHDSPPASGDQGGREFFPIGCRCESFKVEEAVAVERGVGDSHDPAQPEQGLHVDFVPTE
jgi:hypothetical protein